jgi:uncharacterized protein (TIRG00374 family)
LTSARTKTLLVLTNLISIGLLIWVLKGSDLPMLWREVLQLKVSWILFASITDILAYVLQGWRWSILLDPVAKVPVMRTVRAVYVGLFANEVLPLRTGEVIRCYLISRWTKLPISVSLSSVLIERIFDGIWLVLYLAVVLMFVDVPLTLQRGAFGLMLAIAVLVAVMGWVMFYKKQAQEAISTSRWAKTWHTLIEDLHAIGNSRTFYFSWLASLPHLLSMTLPIYGVGRAYGLEMSLAEAAVINVIVRLGTVIPSAPGNLGTYQALVVLSLTMLGYDVAVSKRFSLILWAVVTAPLLLGGFVALSVTGFKIRELQREAQGQPPSAV